MIRSYWYYIDYFKTDSTFLHKETKKVIIITSVQNKVI